MQRELTGKQQGLLMVALCFSSFMTMFIVAGSSVFTAAVATELNGLSFYSLCFTLEALARCIAIAVSGKLGETFGRKKLYMIGVTGYIAATLLCGLSPTMIIFMSGRILAGLFWGLFFSNTFTMLADIYAENSMKMLGFLQSVNTVAMILSTVGSGAIADLLSWRIIFFMILPFLVIALIIIAKLMPENKTTGDASTIDKAGILLTTLAICALTFGLSFGGTYFPWTSPIIIGAFIAAVLLIMLLIRKEGRAKEPLFPAILFKNRNYLAVLFSAFLFVLISLMGNYFTLFAAEYLGASVTLSGTLLMLPNIVATIAASYLGIFMTKHPNRDKAIMIAYGLVATLATALFFTYGPGTSFVVIVISLLIMGLGTAINNVFPVAFAQKSLPAEMIGSGTSFVGFVQGIANSVGMAVFGVIAGFGTVYIFKILIIFGILMLITGLVGMKK